MKVNDPKLASYYRHMAALLKVIRFGVLLAFVMFCVYCIGFFRDTITMDNLRYVLKYIDLSGSDSTPSETEIVINADENSSFVMMHNDLAVISNSGCELYDFGGNKLYSYDYTYTNAAVTSNGNNLLIYDTKGRHFSLFSSVSKMFDKAPEYNVRTGCINDAGYFAIVNSEKTYRSGIIVYNRDGDEMFRYMSPDKYIMSVALNEDASNVLCAAVSNAEGAFLTELRIYNTASDSTEPVYQTVIEDSMAMQVGYSDDGIYVLTDKSFLCYDKELVFAGSADFSRSNAEFFKKFDDCFIIAESNNLSGSSMTVSGYDYRGGLLFKLGTEKKVLDAAYKDATLYVLLRDELLVYDFDTSGEGLKLLAEKSLDKQYRAVRTDDYGRYILVGAKKAKRGSLTLLLEEQLKKERIAAEAEE